MFPVASLSVFATITLISLLTVALCHLATHWAMRPTALRRPVRLAAQPPVSIFKPLAGLDEGLYDNLLSIVEQDYPDFEIIFGVENARDPACVLVRRLQLAHPERRIRLVVGGPKIGVNPKVTNLANIAAVAQNDVVLISDANVRVDADYLRTMAATLAPDVGLVCNIIVGNDAQSLGALLEDLQLNTYITPAMCAAFTFAHPCVVGKSMLLRLSDLERFGGWHTVANVLAEDYVIGQMTHRSGKKVALSSYVVHAVHQHRRFWAFVERHVRWSQMRWRLAPIPYVSELMMNTASWAWVWAGAAMMQHQFAHVTCAAFAWCAKLSLDLGMHRYLSRRPVGLRHALALVLKDAVLPAIWVLGIVCRSVTWRGHSMRIGRGSVVRACVDVTLETPALPRHSV